MQWNGEGYGGFSETRPWIPMSAAFRIEITVKAQRQDVKIPGEWGAYRLLPENYERRELHPGQEWYTMETYEFMVVGKGMDSD